jgi:hypothetical protein
MLTAEQQGNKTRREIIRLDSDMLLSRYTSEI